MEGSRPFTTFPPTRLPKITQGEPPPLVSPSPIRNLPLSYCVRARTSYWRRGLDAHSPFLLTLLHLCLIMCLMLTCSRHGFCSAAPVPPWRSADTNFTTVTWAQEEGLGVDTEAGLYTTYDTTDEKSTFTPGAGSAHTPTSDHSPPSSPQKSPSHPQLTSTRRSAVGVKAEVTPEHPPQSLLQVRSAPAGEQQQQQQGVGAYPGGAAATPHVPATLLKTGSDLTTQPEVTDRHGDRGSEGVTEDILDGTGRLSTTVLTDIPLIPTTGEVQTREQSHTRPAVPTTGNVQEDYYTNVSDGDVTTGSEGQLDDVTVTQDVIQVSDTTTTVVDPDTVAWHSSPQPQHGGTDAAAVAADDVGTGSASSRQLLTTMLIVAHAQTTSKHLAPSVTESYPPKDGDISIDDTDSSWYNGNKTVPVDDLQFDLEDLILAVCGTAASTFTVCMLVTFTRCCCKKQKDDSDGEDASTRRGHRHHHGAGSASAASASSSSSHRSKSLWKRSWKRPLDSGATTATQESSTSADNITQVTIERRESYTDEQDSDLSDGYDEDDDEGGFTKGGRRKRHGDASKSRKPHSKDSDDNATAPSVRDRIRAFEVPSPGTQGEVKVREGVKPRKNKPTSKAFSEFESKGILIGFGGPRGRHGADEEDEDEDRGGSCDSPLGVLLPSPTSGQSLEDTPTSSRGLDDDEGVHTMESEEDEFAAIQRSGEVLKSFRRAPPPRNRSRARRSGRGRRQIRGQDVSSSEQIAEEPSSGSFGSRPTSGINSPATSATPEEEEHETFEASLHMGTNESLSVARSSSISQTPQSSMDSMDSPKRQPSVSSRDSPLRGGGGVGDSPKRLLLDSPKRQQRRAAGDISPRRTPPLGPRSPVASLRPSPGDVTDSGHSDFSLTIPVDFQQQRLGSQPADKAVPHSSGSSGRPRRPISYHVEPSSRGGATEKFRPLRPLSTHHGHQHPGIVNPDVPSSTDIWPPPTSSPNSHEPPLRAHEQTHLHEPPRPHRDSISLSHGHLGRDLGTPVGRVLPQVRGPASPLEMRRWESEHSYLQQEEARNPSQLRKDGGGRGRGQEPEPTSNVASRSRQTLRPTPEDAQVRDHPQSEKLERKVLKKETPPGTSQGPDLPNQSGGIGVQISNGDPGRTNAEVPPPRPPLPSWRKMKSAYDTSNQFPLPPRQPKITLSTRSRSFHVIDPRQRQSKSVDFLPQSGQSRFSGDRPDGLEYDITPDDIRKTWDGMVRSRSLERPIKRLNAQFSTEPYSNHYYSLDNYDDLIRGNSLDVSPDQIRISQAFPCRPSVVKSKSLEMSPERLTRHHQWRNIETELPEPSYDEVENINDGLQLFRPLPTRKSWHGNTKSPKREKSQPKSACGDVPWLRDKDNEENQNLKPSDIRKSMRKSRSHSSSIPASGDAHTNSRGKTLVADTYKDQRTLSQNRSSKTEGQLAHMSLDFKRNVPQSQSVRSPKSRPEYRKADIRYSMRDKPSNWRNIRGGVNSHPSQLKDQRPELALHSSDVPAPLVYSASEARLSKKATNHQAYIDEPAPPRPPLPTENPPQPVNHHTTDYSAQYKYKTPSPAGLPISVSNWGSKYGNPNKSYMSGETSLERNVHQFQGRPKDLHRPPSVDVPPNLVTPEGSLKRQTSLQASQLARKSIGSDGSPNLPVTSLQLGTEKYWSMEGPSVTKTGQQAVLNPGQPNTDLEKVPCEPEIVEHIRPRQNSESEQLHSSQFLGTDSKQGNFSLNAWSAPSNLSDNTMASGHTYVDMTQNLRTDPFSEVSLSPHRPKSTHDELSPVPLSSTFSEPSPVPSDLPPSDHVLRFTRDPRWKESLVKPEAKSMYEVMHGQDVSNMPGFPYTFTPEDHILEAIPTSLLRDTPDVVPLSERKISPRVTTRDNELQFTFNFDTEATEI